MNSQIITSNLFTVANNIHRGVDYFRVKKLKNGQEAIVKNSFLNRCFSSSSLHQDRLYSAISRNVQAASLLGREFFVNEQETTDLYLAVQKYNQTVAALDTNGVVSPEALANRFPWLCDPRK